MTPRYIAIGASGHDGLNDIKELLAGLSWPLPAVVMIVLHRPVDRVSSLRNVLGRTTSMPVIIAEEGEKLEVGNVYIGEPAHHLTLIDKNIAGLVPDPLNKYRNRTIDALFNSLALYAGPAAVGVILSGSLDDGSRGLAAIHHAGGVTMVLAPRRSGAPGMPENALDYDGPVDAIGSPSFLADEIARLIRSEVKGRD